MFVAGPGGDTSPRALWTHGVTHRPPDINLSSCLNFDIGLFSPHDYYSARQASHAVQYEIVCGLEMTTALGFPKHGHGSGRYPGPIILPQSSDQHST